MHFAARTMVVFPNVHPNEKAFIAVWLEAPWTVAGFRRRLVAQAAWKRFISMRFHIAVNECQQTHKSGLNLFGEKKGDIYNQFFSLTELQFCFYINMGTEENSQIPHIADPSYHSYMRARSEQLDV